MLALRLSSYILLMVLFTFFPAAILWSFCRQANLNGGIHGEGIGWTALFMTWSWLVVSIPSYLQLYANLLHTVKITRGIAPFALIVFTPVLVVLMFVFVEQIFCTDVQSSQLRYKYLRDALASDLVPTLVLALIAWFLAYWITPILGRRHGGGAARVAALVVGTSIAYAGFWFWSMRYLFHGSNYPPS